MSPDVEIFDATTVGSLRWPERPTGLCPREFLTTMVRDGVSTYLENARVEMRLIRVEDVVLPIVIAGGTRGNSNVCSTESHFIRYASWELGAHGTSVATWLLRKGLGALGLMLRMFLDDRAVYVNNWLLTTNPSMGLKPRHVRAITDRLKETFPDRAIVFRSVDRVSRGRLWRILGAAGYVPIGSRKVYVLDGTDRRKLKRQNVKRDMKLIRTTPYEMVDASSLADADFPRIRALYRQLYLEKYSPLNPRFNDAFFRLAARTGFLQFRAFRRDGRIDAFCGYYVSNGMVTAPTVGYDLGLPRSLGLYRLLMLPMTLVAFEQGITLNMSSGAGSFKKMRGGEPTVECQFVHIAHLPPHRQVPWHLLRIFFNERLVARFHQ